MKHLFLAPHHDDAIYSCGGTIYTLVQEGHEVTILTLMAGIPDEPVPDTPVLRDNHQRWDSGQHPLIIRRQEDELAAEIVRASVQHLDLLDCIYRVAASEALYPSEDSLWKDIHPNDPAIKQLTAIKLPEADVIYAPLGVGEHVDHLIVRNWAWKLAQNTDFLVKFYVEYPYLRSQKNVEIAYQAFPTTLQTEQFIFTEIAMQHKIKAMTAYTSQIKSFWSSQAEIASEVRGTFTKDKQFIEAYAVPLNT